jgi:hypothetical protein
MLGELRPKGPKGPQGPKGPEGPKGRLWFRGREFKAFPPTTRGPRATVCGKWRGTQLLLVQEGSAHFNSFRGLVYEERAPTTSRVVGKSSFCASSEGAFPTMDQNRERTCLEKLCKLFLKCDCRFVFGRLVFFSQISSMLRKH